MNNTLKFLFKFVINCKQFFFLFVIIFKGLRITALVGVIGTCIGAWIKVFSVSPDAFFVGFFGQSIVALSQVSTRIRQIFIKTSEAYLIHIQLEYEIFFQVD